MVSTIFLGIGVLLQWRVTVYNFPDFCREPEMLPRASALVKTGRRYSLFRIYSDSGRIAAEDPGHAQDSDTFDGGRYPIGGRLRVADRSGVGERHHGA